MICDMHVRSSRFAAARCKAPVQIICSLQRARSAEQVSKLKNEAGNAFTGRMEAMFNDMRISVDTNESFREYSDNSREAEAGAQGETRKDGGVELVAHVLTTGCWPSVSAKQEVRVCLLPTSKSEE